MKIAMHNDHKWWNGLEPTLVILIVMGLVSGFMYIEIDPVLQSILPLDEWTPVMKIVHYVPPFVFVLSIGLALALACDAFEGLLYKYFTHRKTVIALAFWGCVLMLFFLFWIPSHFVGELLELSGKTR